MMNEKKNLFWTPVHEPMSRKQECTGEKIADRNLSRAISSFPARKEYFTQW